MGEDPNINQKGNNEKLAKKQKSSSGSDRKSYKLKVVLQKDTLGKDEFKDVKRNEKTTYHCYMSSNMKEPVLYGMGSSNKLDFNKGKKHMQPIRHSQ